jgi:hypothetical protein
MQALVSPPGETPGSGQGSRWTPVFELALGSEDPAPAPPATTDPGR